MQEAESVCYVSRTKHPDSICSELRHAPVCQFEARRLERPTRFSFELPSHARR